MRNSNLTNPCKAIFFICSFLFITACCNAQYLQGEWKLKHYKTGMKDSSATKVLLFCGPVVPIEMYFVFTDDSLTVIDTARQNSISYAYKFYEKKAILHVICKDAPTDFDVQQRNKLLILTDNKYHVVFVLKRKKQFINGKTAPGVKHPTPVP